MNINSNSYVLGFATCVCVGVSTALALVANGLKDLQTAAAEFDRQKNVMIAAGLCAADDERSQADLKTLFEDRVTEVVVDTQTGEAAADVTIADVKLFRSDAMRDRYRVIATTKDESGALEAVVLPISGKGLWSQIYGYIALESDVDTVRGITFYKHGETPGLGGEVENADWQDQWRGIYKGAQTDVRKKILDDEGELVSIALKKTMGTERDKHAVDGLAGATITCNGVTDFLLADLEALAAYLDKLRNS